MPVYNEEAIIENVVKQFDNKQIESLGVNEIIVIDDGSTDSSYSIISRIKFANNISLIVLQNDRNYGYGYSLKRGVNKSKNPYFLFFDGDGQHKLESVFAMIKNASTMEEFDLIIGTRTESSSSPRWRRPGKSLVKFIAETITQTEMPDLFSGLRLWNKSSFNQMRKILPDKFSISATSAIASTYFHMKVIWLPVVMEKRVGKSSASLKTGIGIIILIARIFTLFAPLRIFFPLSAIVALAGAYFTFNSYLNEGVSSIRGIIAFLTAITIALQGLVVDQISSLRRGEKIEI